MPYFQVTLNGKELVVGGDDQADVISLSLIATKNSPSLSLDLSGIRRLEDGKVEHVSWCRAQINVNDRLKISAFKKAVPEVTKLLDSSSVTSIKELSWAQREQLESKTPEICQATPLGAQQFNLKFSDSAEFFVRGTEETLQLVATWLGASDSGKVVVDSISVMDNGTTQGKRWLERVLLSGEWLEVVNRPGF